MRAAAYPTTMEKTADRRAMRKLLFIAGLSALVMFLPFLIADGGRFSLISDFNFQQIPFNMHANWAVKNGQIGWDWFTDLGVNFIGAFSFYNLGSPFFWLSLLFPKEAFPYLIGWFYMLKYVTAAVCAFLWIRTHVKDPDYAVIGAMLYAFSGFAHVNLQFYHFHEVIAFFPLLLHALDRLVLEDRKGWFAVTTALMALVNYFFFFGQVLFLILYFFTVYRSGSRLKRRERLLAVLREGILGVLAAAVLLLPSALFIIYSPKAGSMLGLSDFFLFSKERYLMILKAFLFPAEGMPMQSALFLFDYSSAAIYLPAVGLSLALAGFRTSRYRRLLAILIFMAFVPVLNASFTMFNSLYYARWFYMPALILAALSAERLEKARPEDNIRGVQFTLLLTLFFMGLLFLMKERGLIYFVEGRFLFSGLLALSGLILTWLILLRGSRVHRSPRVRANRVSTDRVTTDRASGSLTQGPSESKCPAGSRSMGGSVGRHEKRTGMKFLALVTVFSVITGIYTIALTRSTDREETRAFAGGYLSRTAGLELGRPADEDFRFYTAEPAWNLSLLNRIPSVNSFITTNSPSTYEFFHTVGIRHIPTSLFPEEVHDILTFLSTRYRLDTEASSEWTPRYSQDNGYQMIHVSENPDFIPLGFPLDHYIPKSRLMEFPEDQRARVLLQAMVVADGEAAPTNLTSYDGAAFSRSVEEIARSRRARAVKNFRRDSGGFSADLSASKETTLLFTVPADPGWQAFIDGKAVPYSKSLGFLALNVPAGSHRIEFTYRIPGLLPGAILSLAGWALIILSFRKNRRK